MNRYSPGIESPTKSERKLGQRGHSVERMTMLSASAIAEKKIGLMIMIVVMLMTMESGCNGLVTGEMARRYKQKLSFL